MFGVGFPWRLWLFIGRSTPGLKHLRGSLLLDLTRPLLARGSMV